MVRLLRTSGERPDVPTPAVEFTVRRLTAAVAATIPDRELIIQGDRRYSYADIVERSNRLAAYLHSRGLWVATQSDRRWMATKSGMDLLGLYAYNGNEFVERCWALSPPGSRRFNVNFRYVQERVGSICSPTRVPQRDLPRLLRAAGSRGVAGSSAACGSDSNRRRFAQMALLLTALWTSGDHDHQLGIPRRPPSSIRPMICTSSTPAAPPGCRKACSGANTNIFMTSVRRPKSE